jgi:molybdopterin molybdotransferase
MISPTEALDIVLRQTRRLEPVHLPVLEAIGCVLAEAVLSDIDLPPFDKSAMDGFAARSADIARVPVELEIVEELPAGVAPRKRLTPGTCARIMTGAPVPEGADMVVMVEDTAPAGTDRVRILRADPRHANICRRGEDVRCGVPVLSPGHAVRAPEVALLASVGVTRVCVYRRPTVAVLATGDELVAVEEVPEPAQIRDANSWGLRASCRRAGVEATDLGVARDDERGLREKIARGLEHDVLIVSGGVSTGEWDLVPRILAEAGLTTHFTAIRQKPGKPTNFCTGGRGVVFGLPGNPVATLVGFRLYVWPAIRKMMGYAVPAPPPIRVTLAGGAEVRGNRLTYVPAILGREPDRATAETIETMGSADLVGFSKADALLVLEPGRYDAGTPVEALPLEL